MKHGYSLKIIRLGQRPTPHAADAAAALHKARYAEELADVETTVSRATLLLRSVKQAA